MKPKTSKQPTLRQLKTAVYGQHQVKNSQELKRVSVLAATLDLRYKQSWNILMDEDDMSDNNVIFLADHIVKKDLSASVLETGLKSLREDLTAFAHKIESDFAVKRQASQKYRESLTYL